MRIARLTLMTMGMMALSCTPKKKEAVEPMYTVPEIEWPEDEDLDDLPEAGEEDTGVEI